MKILIMHQVPYRKIQYHLGIDHERHDVWYFGAGHDLAQVPRDLRCTRVEVPGESDLASEIIARTAPADGFEQVLALSEFGILEAARIREHLRIPGPSERKLELVRDKVAMKRAVAEAGVRHPRFVEVPDPGQPLPWDGRTVVKPRRGASSTGVSVHQTAADALARYWSQEEPGAFELEEFVTGDMFHADGLVEHHAVTDLVVSRYIGRLAEFALGAPIATVQIPTDPAHERFIARALAGVCVDEGCFHLEYFQTPAGELVFLEVANRLGGAGIVDEFLRRTGVHLPTHEIAIRLGFERPEPEPPSGRFHGFALFPGHLFDPGRPLTLDIPGFVSGSPLVDEIHTLAEIELSDGPGGKITYQEWLVPVFIAASHPDPEVLAEFLTMCATAVSVRQEPVVTSEGVS
jgi:hypothetical protein